MKGESDFHKLQTRLLSVHKEHRLDSSVVTASANANQTRN